MPDLDTLERGSMDHGIDTVHRTHQAIAIAHVADEVAYAGVLTQALAHGGLGVFAAGVDADAVIGGTPVQIVDVCLTEGTRTACDQNRTHGVALNNVAQA